MSQHRENADKNAKAILSGLIYITAATVGSDFLPWVSPVFAAFDEAYQFFWVSASEARHSQNINATHRVAIVVYDSTVPAGTGKGVYIQGTADELTEEQGIIHALQTLEQRGWKKPLNEVVGASIQRVYRAVPERMWISAVDSPNGQRFDTGVAIDLFRTSDASVEVYEGAQRAKVIGARRSQSSREL
jgi:nitroimidazol reductase NimA-like FMN-containing flavoprotein (pyridoxamine 5'-phosphate oxidase superfamily)